jgi:hypothetical protein
MKQELVVVKDHELRVGTWTLAQGFGVEHRSLTRLVKRYESEFLEFEENRGPTPLRPVTPKKGGPQFDECLLNEGQAIFLTTLLTNNTIVRSFKRLLSKEFVKQRKVINDLRIAIRINQNNAEWLEKRASGKIERRVATDIMKIFTEYASSQGSKNAKKYYMTITKMENSALFHLEFLQCEYKNLRDIVSGFQLDALKMADHIIEKALKDGMDRRMYYKDIFRLAKSRIETFADSMGKMTVELKVIN